MRIGIMGGTFNPVHNGHLAIAQCAASQLNLDRILFIPTGNPHFKLDQKLASKQDRAAMVELAIAENPLFELDLREIERPGVTYTVDTLEELRQKYPNDELFFILGSDSAYTLHMWKRANEIAELCTIVVAQRPGQNEQLVTDSIDDASICFNILYIDSPMVNVSSTEIRNRIAQGKSIYDLVPVAVAKYIDEHELYKFAESERKHKVKESGKKENSKKDGDKKEKNKKLLKRVTKAVDQRLSGKRLVHAHSVSDYAAKLAKAYGVNVTDARIAGLLHDWDKLLTDEEFPSRLEELGIEPPENIEYLYPVLHSFTGAEAVKREFPELNDDIISAIYNHTLGSLEMSDLDIVIFVADMIEPGRKAKGRPELKHLRRMAGNVSLELLYFEAYAATIRSLVDRKRYIHPMAIDIWNGLVEKYHPVDITRQGNPNAIL